MQGQIIKIIGSKQIIFVAIDVHLKNWTVTILTENIVHKTFTQPATTSVLTDYLIIGVASTLGV